MSIAKILSKCSEVSIEIKRFEIELVRNDGDGYYYNAYEILKPTRHFCMLASCIPDTLLSQCLQRLDRDVDPQDREAISKYHGEALAAVDILSALAEDPDAFEQTSPADDAGLSHQSRTMLASARRMFSSLEAKIAELEAEVNRLRSGDFGSLGLIQSTSSATDMHPKEKTSLQKIVLGIALEQYGYHPDKRSNAVSQIVTDLKQHGLKISGDNVRDKLRVAWDELKDQIPAE